MFLDIPHEWPVTPEEYELTLEDIFNSELLLWEQRASELHTSIGTIADAWNQNLDVVKLTSFIVAVVCKFAEHTGIALEFPFGFLFSMVGWLCHKDVHAHEVRQRAFVVLIGDSNVGKSPFYRLCVDLICTSTSGRPSLLETHAMLFADGGGKPIFVAQATQGDFAKRMHECGGVLFWASEEAWAMLDVPWALGKGRVKMDPGKVAHCYLLNTQNGWSFGPCSVKAEQYHAPTTNFGMFHAGQATVVHEYWGTVFTAGCPFKGMGWGKPPNFPMAR